MIKPTFSDVMEFRAAVREGDRIVVRYTTQSGEGSFLTHVDDVSTNSVKAGRFSVSNSVEKDYIGRCGEFEEATIVEA